MSYPFISGHVVHDFPTSVFPQMVASREFDHRNPGRSQHALETDQTQGWKRQRPLPHERRPLVHLRR